MSKVALVVSGGGSKGAFAVGVLESLLDRFPGFHFDILVGTSAGSLIVPFAAQSDMKALEDVYHSVTTDGVITKFSYTSRFFFNNDSLFSVKPLINLIDKHYTDDSFNALRKQKAAVYLATTCLQTGKAVYFSNKKPPPASDFTIELIEDGAMFRRAVLASASQPVFMPPVEIRPHATPIRQYVDGGMRQYAGIQLAVELGADEIFAVILSCADNPPEDINYNKVFPILVRALDIFVAGVRDENVYIPQLFNSGVQYITNVQQRMRQAGISEEKIDDFFDHQVSPFAHKAAVRLHILRPEAPLGGGPGGLEFDPAQMKAMLAKGRNYMKGYLAELKCGDSVLV
jgi:predicted acylesterase/phospholipase RssA